MKRTKKFLLLLALLTAAAILWLPSETRAAAFIVNNIGDAVDVRPGDRICETASGNGICTLRAAIMEANALIGDDSISFSVTGTITLTSALPNISGSLTIAGPGASNLTISGANAYRVFYLESNITLNLQNLTIANGNVADSSGGGVFCLTNNTLTVTNSTFSGNSALSGGAISGCYQTITNSTFTGNSATGDYSNGTGTGGAISCVSLTVTNSAFSGNTAQRGGAIRCDGTLAVTNSTFTNNSVNGVWYPRGGAMLIYGPSTITNSTFSGNSASGSSVKSGGAIDMPSTYGLTIANSTFSGNTVSGAGTNWGGAIYKYSSVPSTLTITNSTFSGNSASGGTSNLAGGIYNDGVTNVTLQNTIIANSPSGGNCSGAITDGGNNLQFPDAICGATIPMAAPLLGALTNNGGPTQTMALGGGSPAIDAANPANCPATDQRGYSRSNNCDIGAYEFDGAAASPSANLSVTKTDSSDPVTVGNNLTYTITITNNGPDTATSVTLTDTLPGGVTYVSATPSQGSCSQSGGVVTCSIGSLANSASATVAIVVTPTTAGTITNTASVTATETDLNAADNSASQDTTVSAAGGGSGADSGSGSGGGSGGGGCGQLNDKMKNNQQPFSGSMMLILPVTWLLFRRAIRKMLNAQALQISRP